MKQVNLMEHLTNIKLLEDDNKKEIQKNNESKQNILEQTKKLNNIEKRKLCNSYLIPLLYKHFKFKNKLIADALQAIKEDGPKKKFLFSQEKFMDVEITKTFVYQTCLNFVEEYSDFILTPKLSKQTKEELIINAFLYSDFDRKLIKANRGIEKVENGCYVSIDLHKICSNNYNKKNNYIWQ